MFCCVFVGFHAPVKCAFTSGGVIFLKSLCLLEQDGEQSSQLSEHEYQPSVELNEADKID